MKGVIFTEFLDMVAEHFSPEMVDDILDDTAPPHGGAYTAVGTYPFGEMVALLGALARRTRQDTDTLLHAFGRHLFTRFTVLYPRLIAQADSALPLVASIEHVIHTEVRKLYPDAELPRFTVESCSPRLLSVIYQSPRCLATLAQGLIEGAIAHYGEQASIRLTREALSADHHKVRFVLEKA